MHYAGWRSTWDEWISLDSPRLDNLNLKSPLTDRVLSDELQETTDQSGNASSEVRHSPSESTASDVISAREPDNIVQGHASKDEVECSTGQAESKTNDELESKTDNEGNHSGNIAFTISICEVEAKNGQEREKYEIIADKAEPDNGVISRRSASFLSAPREDSKGSKNSAPTLQPESRIADRLHRMRRPSTRIMDFQNSLKAHSERPRSSRRSEINSGDVALEWISSSDILEPGFFHSSPDSAEYWLGRRVRVRHRKWGSLEGVLQEFDSGQGFQARFRNITDNDSLGICKGPPSAQWLVLPDPDVDLEFRKGESASHVTGMKRGRPLQILRAVKSTRDELAQNPRISLNKKHRSARFKVRTESYAPCLQTNEGSYHRWRLLSLSRHRDTTLPCS